MVAVNRADLLREGVLSEASLACYLVRGTECPVGDAVA